MYSSCGVCTYNSRGQVLFSRTSVHGHGLTLHIEQSDRKKCSAIKSRGKSVIVVIVVEAGKNKITKPYC